MTFAKTKSKGWYHFPSGIFYNLETNNVPNPTHRRVMQPTPTFISRQHLQICFHTTISINKLYKHINKLPKCNILMNQTIRIKLMTKK